jgi:hypothetical protein
MPQTAAGLGGEGADGYLLKLEAEEELRRSLLHLAEAKRRERDERKAKLSSMHIFERAKCAFPFFLNLDFKKQLMN